MNQPVETALVSIVKAATPSLEKVPVEYRAELEAMEELGDADLWQAAESVLPADQQRQLVRLLEKNRGGKLTERDHFDRQPAFLVPASSANSARGRNGSVT